MTRWPVTVLDCDMGLAAKAYDGMTNPSEAQFAFRNEAARLKPVPRAPLLWDWVSAKVGPRFGRL